MNCKQLLSVVSLVVTSTIALAESDDKNIQFGLSQHHMTTQVSTSSGSWLQGSLRGHGLDAYYLYSRYATVGAGYYQIHSCLPETLEGNLTCQVDTPIHGTHLSFLVGYNLDRDGLYIFTGARYYWEWNDKARFGEATIPIGIGFRLVDFSVDVSSELRGDYTDYGAFDIFGVDPDSSYELGSQWSETLVTTLPVKVSLGYQF